MEEVDILKRHGTVKILAIHAPKEKRLLYLKERKRSDAPTSTEEFDARDKRELEVGLGKAISYADSIIMNDGAIEELERKAHAIIERWKATL
jgi:dephospho-CoA kinase